MSTTNIQAQGLATQTPDVAPGDDPPKSGFERFTVAYTTPRVIRGANESIAETSIYEAVTWAIMAGCQIEHIRKLEYRVFAPRGLSGPDGSERLYGVSCFVERRFPGVLMPYEEVSGGIHITLRRFPRAVPLRYASVEGNACPAYLAIAIGLRMNIEPVGPFQFRVYGSTRDFATWFGAVSGRTYAEALKELGIDEATAIAEDSGPAPVLVDLPTRESTTSIERDQMGEIFKVTQRERSLDRPRAVRTNR